MRNRGIGGETTIGALQRLEIITQGKPDKLFLMLGINDLGENRNVLDILKTYDKILRKLKSESPTTKVIVESVLPVLKYKEKIVCCENANEKIIKLNDGLKNLSNKYDLIYLDLHQYFFDNGGLKPDLTIDGIHLNGEGYLMMSEFIKPFLE